MALKNQKWDKLMELFFEEPNKTFTIREISRLTKIPTSSIQRYLKEFVNEGLITKDNKANLTEYYKFRKSMFLIENMLKFNLIKYLEEHYKPSCIIVFGSIRKGEYTKGSDIDIFVESTKKPEINLTNFEKKLKHPIQLFIEKDINDLPNRLFNNVINGIKLTGYFKIR